MEKVKKYDEIWEIVKSNEASQLLGIEDYYREELTQLAEEELDIDFEQLTEEEYEKFFSDAHLKEITTNKSISRKLKDAIKIYIESKDICAELYEFIQEYSKLNDIEKLEYEISDGLKKAYTDDVREKIKKFMSEKKLKENLNR